MKTLLFIFLLANYNNCVHIEHDAGHYHDDHYKEKYYQYGYQVDDHYTGRLHISIFSKGFTRKYFACQEIITGIWSTQQVT